MAITHPEMSAVPRPEDHRGNRIPRRVKIGMAVALVPATYGAFALQKLTDATENLKTAEQPANQSGERPVAAEVDLDAPVVIDEPKANEVGQVETPSEVESAVQLTEVVRATEPIAMDSSDPQQLAYLMYSNLYGAQNTESIEEIAPFVTTIAGSVNNGTGSAFLNQSIEMFNFRQRNPGYEPLDTPRVIDQHVSENMIEVIAQVTPNHPSLDPYNQYLRFEPVSTPGVLDNPNTEVESDWVLTKSQGLEDYENSFSNAVIN